MRRLLLLLSILILSSCGLNTEIDGHAVIQNKNARMALSLGFDKNFIAEELFSGGSIESDYFIPEDYAYFGGKPFREYADKYNHYDPALAKEYWAKAKKELGFEEITIELLVYDTETSTKTAEFIKQELEEYLEGLTIQIMSLPFAEKIERAGNGDFQMHWTGWRPDDEDPLNMLSIFTTGSAFNESGWSNEQYDQLLTKEYSDEHDRLNSLVQAEKILLEDAAIIPLYQRSFVYLTNENFKGLVNHQTAPGNSFKWASSPTGNVKLVETSDIPTMDPNAASDSVSFLIIGNTMEGLTRLTDTSYELAGASDVKISEDGLTYTFTLRETYWVDSSGESYAPVTAYDYEFSWNRLKDESNAFEYSEQFEKAKIEMFEALDESTFVVKFEAVSPLHLKSLAFPVLSPINEEFYYENIDNFGKTNHATLYNGPFYLNTWTIGEEHILTKNNYYWDSNIVSLENILYRVINNADDGMLVDLYLKNEIDRVKLTGENIKIHENREDSSRIDSSLMAYITFNLNEE